MTIAGVIIAGGKSTRMGGHEKAFLKLAGKPLLQHVIDRLRPQVEALAINANGDAARFAEFGLPVIADTHRVGTPLAGLEAALAWGKAQNAELVLTVPSDSPELPVDLVRRLRPEAPAIATSNGQDHYLTGLWPVPLHAMLLNAMQERGLRAVKDFARLAGVRRVEWPVLPRDPFLNLNSPEDVEAYEHS